MKNIIKKIREQSGLSQEQFALELNTTVVSINRWENGKSIPNIMAQNQLFAFCGKHAIDIGSMIVDKYRYSGDADSGILYHGSKKGLTGDIALLSRPDCDFGTGFYMGTDTLQPLTLICGEKKPKFYIMKLDLSDLKVIDIELGMEWAMLIAYHRGYMDTIKGSDLYNRYAHFLDGYDYAIGYIANDRLYTELTRFFGGDITDAALMKCLSALDLGRQYVALTKRGCEAITVLSEQSVSPLELLALQERSIARRKEGNALAKEIEKEYRRTGKYFDEILRGE